jgi:mannose-1-phosphate guanylyltransferase/mannose-6-phosphate isomerase
MISVILAGGIGSRFWPLSTTENPKQFLPIFEDNKSLFDLALDRLSMLDNEKVLTVTNYKYKHFLKNYKTLPLYEPYGRNTFGAFVLTLKYLFDSDKLDTPLLFIPSDHMILDKKSFSDDINNAVKIVEEQDISIMLGVTPQHPETGYGYIKASRVINNEVSLYGVKGFKEKPELQLAEYYLNIGGYYWNCGILITKGRILLEEIKEKYKDLYDIILQKDSTFLFDNFDLIPNIPVEKAIIEESRRIAMIKVSFDWSDLGSWDSYFKFIKNSKSKNVIENNSTNNHVLTNKKTVLIDVDDITIIESENGLLVMKNNSYQKLKDALME